MPMLGSLATTTTPAATTNYLGAMPTLSAPTVMTTPAATTTSYLGAMPTLSTPTLTTTPAATTTNYLGATPVPTQGLAAPALALPYAASMVAVPQTNGAPFTFYPDGASSAPAAGKRDATVAVKK